MISNKSSESSKTISSPIKARKRFRAFSVTTLITLTTFTTAQNIWDIQASFCNSNQTKTEIDLVTKSNLDTDICIDFSNNSLQDTTISINFVDWAITPQWDKACFSAEKPKTNFGQYIQLYENKLTIPWNSNLQQHFKIKYPVWYSGVSHGCLAYAINNESNIEWWIAIVFRKVHTIDILVWWTQINSNIKFQNIYITWDWVSNRINIDIKNDGNINQEIAISGTISNLFWYKQTFDIQPIVLHANSTSTITTNTLNLPNYKWIFTIKTNLNYTPIFNFDITNHNIPTQYILPWVMTITKSIILRNWYYIIWLSTIIILILINFIKYLTRRKNT